MQYQVQCLEEGFWTNVTAYLEEKDAFSAMCAYANGGWDARIMALEYNEETLLFDEGKILQTMDSQKIASFATV